MSINYKQQPLNSLTHMRDAFLVFVTLAVMTLVNAGQLWEGQKNSIRFLNFELTQILDLDKSQVEKIQAINVVYEIEVSRLGHDKGVSKNEKVNALLTQRNDRIMEVLNEQQQKSLRAYCTELIFITQMFE
jgi:hypothetical protein